MRAAAAGQTMGDVLRSIALASVWSIAAVMVLGELGINLGPLIAPLGSPAWRSASGHRASCKDFLAGIFILVEDQYGVGDIVDVGEATGTLVRGRGAVSLRTDAAALDERHGVARPQRQIVRVGNMSQQWARALLDVSVAYGSDLDGAQEAIKRRPTSAGPALAGDARGARAVGRREPRPPRRDDPPRREDAARRAVPRPAHCARGSRPRSTRRASGCRRRTLVVQPEAEPAVAKRARPAAG